MENERVLKIFKHKVYHWLRSIFDFRRNINIEMRKIIRIILILIALFFIGRYIYFKIYYSPENIKERQMKIWNERVKNN